MHASHCDLLLTLMLTIHVVQSKLYNRVKTHRYKCLLKCLYTNLCARTNIEDDLVSVHNHSCCVVSLLVTSYTTNFSSKKEYLWENVHIVFPNMLLFPCS